MFSVSSSHKAQWYIYIYIYIYIYHVLGNGRKYKRAFTV
jgi:hypothetical protein